MAYEIHGRISASRNGSKAGYQELQGWTVCLNEELKISFISHLKLEHHASGEKKNVSMFSISLFDFK